MKKFLLGAASLAALLPSMVAAQAYTPTASDTMYVSDRTNTRHTVNAADYIQTQGGSPGGTVVAGTLNILGTSTGYTNLKSGLSSTSNNALTLPTEATDTLVDLTGTQTLTNKTLTAPTMTAPVLGAAKATSLSIGTTLAISGTAPTIASGFGTSPSIPHANGTAAFTINVGTSNTGTGVLTMPTAANGWECKATDTTTVSTTVEFTTVVPTSTTSVTFQNYSDIAGTHDWVDSDILSVQCVAY